MTSKKGSGRRGSPSKKNGRPQRTNRRLAWIDKVDKGHKASLRNRGLFSAYFNSPSLTDTIKSTQPDDTPAQDTIVCFYQRSGMDDGLTVLAVYDPDNVTDPEIVGRLARGRELYISQKYAPLTDILVGAPPHLEGQHYVMEHNKEFLKWLGVNSSSPVETREVSMDEVFFGMNLKHMMPEDRNVLTAIIGGYFPPKQ